MLCKKINLCKIDPPKASRIPGTPPPSIVSVIETKPVFEVAALKSEIKPTKPVAKPTKQLSSVVRVVSANSVASSASSSSSLPLSVNANNAPKSPMSKVQIVSTHVEAIDESKKSAPKSVVHVEAIDGAAILPSRVEIVGGVLPSKSYVDCLIIYFNSLHPFGSPSNVFNVHFHFFFTLPIGLHFHLLQIRSYNTILIKFQFYCAFFTFCRSTVEIHTSEDLDQLPTVENNINDPEYEFLSREPSELTEETYRLPAASIRYVYFNQDIFKVLSSFLLFFL